LFAPSLGVALAIGSAWYLVAGRMRGSISRTGLLVVSGALLWFAAIRSIVQTASWRSNETLFLNSVRSSPLSYRSHYVRGSWLMATGRRAEGEREYTRAIGLFPNDPIVLYNFAQELQNERRLGAAFHWFSRVDSLNPAFFDVKARLAVVSALRGDLRTARGFAEEASARGTGDPAMLRSIIRAASVSDSVARGRNR
jgi:tetratricopeptide (TPR) repeat protein